MLQLECFNNKNVVEKSSVCVVLDADSTKALKPVISDSNICKWEVKNCKMTLFVIMMLLK